MRRAYDYVIVGAGTAGCLLANRLSSQGASVALLEAGPPDRNPWLKVPIGFSRTFRDPTVNWCYETEPQPQLGGRRIFWPRGRVLGGSSAINGMVYIRGHPADFDAWEAEGLRGWGWESVLPAFRRTEGQLCDLPETYGSAGPIAISSVPVRNRASQAFVDAAVASGLPRVRTFNTETQEGAGLYQINTRRGWRSSSAEAYLDTPTRRRIEIVTGFKADRVAIREGRAVGVAGTTAGGELRFDARAEVVICCGAVETPALLQRSGIGHPEDLVAAGVPVLVSSPEVGRNLQDHFGVRIIARLSEPLSINDHFRRPWRLIGHALRYALFRDGQLAVGGAEAGAFARTEHATGRPDIQFHFLPLSSERAGWSFHPFSGVTANVCQLRPRSSGTVRIVDRDPSHPPAIDPAYLEDEWDQKVMVAAVGVARRIFSYPPLRSMVEEEVNPGRGCRTPDEVLRYIRAHGSTVFHPVGTCAMGARATAPLDADCRVRGVAGLRVVDASSMPTLVSGNTNATVTMIAERIATRMLA